MSKVVNEVNGEWMKGIIGYGYGKMILMIK